MWYSVDIRKDGTVSKVQHEADNHNSDGSRKIFVEASSKEEAILKAKAEWERWKTKKLQAATARGLCCECFARQCKPGIKRCQVCSSKRANRKKEQRAIHRLPANEAKDIFGQRAINGNLNRKLSMEISSAVGNQIKSSAADEKLDRNGLKPQAYTPGTLLRFVARAYDRDPENFREWLEGQIESMTGVFSKENRAQA